MIEINDLFFYYHKDTPLEKKALNGISFKIEKGECLGIVGSSGSGKSTLAQHLNGLLSPHKGKIFIDGEDITDKKCNLSKLRKKVGLVFQFPEEQLFEETVFQDIAYGIKDDGLSNYEIIERIKSIFKLLNMQFEKVYNRSPFQLSGGEKRKVSLAGIFVMNPTILILDEPTAGLDPISLEETILYIEKLKFEQNKTIIIISHNMHVIARLCNRILGLKNGEVKFFGETIELLKQKKLLDELDLALPEITSLIFALKEKKIYIKENIHTIPEVAREILNNLR